MTVVVHPASDLGVVSLRQLVQADGGLSREVPLADRLSDPLHGRCTDRRQKARPYLTVAVLGTSRPKFIPQKRKARLGILFPAVTVLAIDDAGLLRMQFQFAVLQPLLNGRQQLLCLSLASAMRHRVIRVTGERIGGMLPLHPFIEGIR